MAAPDRVYKLVEAFDRERDALKRPDYNEYQLRVEFLDPLFESLGWDVHNRNKVSITEREVINEDALKVGQAHRAPDYGFYANRERKFFVEAKKPIVNLKLDPSPAFQLRRYAWTAKLGASVLSDFEEFSIYDARYQPSQNDSAAVARALHLRYSDYVDKWDEIAALFSKEAVLDGVLEQRFPKEGKGPRGSATVDRAFLTEIERWRELLAKNIALRNPDLTQRELNFAVQMTVDRILFLRMAEDRGIETYERLAGIAKGEGVYARLRDLYRQADERYNSGLFHFTTERDRPEVPDTLTPRLVIDDRVLRDIFRNLYYPKSPYEFSVLPVDVLGQVYEQFLGKVISVPRAGRVEIEEKPEVRKAGGVYYTPTYIVDYIVEHTVGKLLEGKTPRQARSIRIVDPACGSGSFLLGAYGFLLDWYRDWYVADGPEKHPKELVQIAADEWRLTTAERKRIMTDHIYGVDIDPQAVEVTKLSLMLKLLEGENDQTLTRQLQFAYRERVLPDMGANIKCGNSLIGPDFYDNQQMSLLPEADHYRINVFDWQAEFPEIMKRGGFDAVIGNPPYIRIQALKEWAPIEVEHYKRAYRSASKGNYDIYVVFVERGLHLLNKQGKLGYILPHKFFNAQYGEPLRELITDGKHLSEVVHFGDQQVFSGATTYTTLMMLDKAGSNDALVTRVPSLDQWQRLERDAAGIVDTSTLSGKPWNLVAGASGKLLARLTSTLPSLEEVGSIYVGVQTSADNVFILSVQDHDESHIVGDSKILGRRVQLERSATLPLASGVDVRRYTSPVLRQCIIYPYQVVDGVAKLNTLREFEESYPLTLAYLRENERTLRARERGKFNDREWYRFGRSQNLGSQLQPKLCVPRLVTRILASVDSQGMWCMDNVDVNGVVLREAYQETDLRYLAGVVNSKLAWWLFPMVSAPFRGGFWSANRQFLGQLPIRTINFGNPADVARHDQMVELVNWMLTLHEQRQAARTGLDQRILTNQIEATDRQIDRLVYELYGLSDDEVRIVEEATAR